MLTASTALRNTLKRGLATSTKPRVIAEWNQNRYGVIQTVDNWGYPEETYGADLDFFPIGEIVKPNRPGRGLPKAFVGESVSESPDRDMPSAARYHAMDPDAAYKYWVGPNQSDGGGNIGNFQPYVIYENSVRTNKIVVGFENSWASPNSWAIDVTTNGTTWSQVASNTALDSKGRAIVYLQAGGSWTTTVNRDNYTSIRGVRVRVNTINQGASRLGIIEISARLERDLSEYVIGYSADMNMDEPDYMLPIGTVSSNSGSVTFSNTDRIFDNENPASIYFGLIDKHVRFEVSVGIDTTQFGGTGLEYTRVATMYADSWSGDTEVQVSFFDRAIYLQEIDCPNLLLRRKTAGEIIWRLLDAAGFTDYQYNREDAGGLIIPYFWVTTDQTIWEAIREVCRVTQTAVYFDANDVLQICPRSKAFDGTRAVDWQLDAVPNGSDLPDIIDLNPTWNLEANHVTIKYRETEFKQTLDRKPSTEILWSPEEDQLLRSSALRQNMDSTQDYIKLEQADGDVWPYEGYINLEGEIIKYKGKTYSWYNKQGQITYSRVTTDEEKRDIDQNQSRQAMAWANKFTGQLHIVKRGVWDTYPDSHKVDLREYWGTYTGTFGNGAMAGNSGIVTQRSNYSSVRIHTKSYMTTNDVHLMLRGGSGSTAYRWYGCRMMIDPSATHGIAGLVFRKQGDGNLAGYYLQIISTEFVNRAGRHYDEVKLVRVNTNGSAVDLAGRGQPVMIAKGVWHDIDVAFSPDGISVMVNGIHAGKFNDGSGFLGGGRLGLFAQGHSPVDFEYVYANNRPERAFADDFGMSDKYRGAIVSDQGDKNHDYGYRTYTRKVKGHSVTSKQVVNYRFFDEFGPYAHELRLYDTKFEKFPVAYSHPYVSNSSKTAIVEYNSTPFGGKFWIANAYRDHAVVHGEDERGVNQQLFIYGRPIVVQDAKEHVVKSDELVQRRGKIPVEFESDWLQTESAARSLGEWIVNNWGTTADNADATMFGNPLFQIGDLVTVNYPLKSMAPATHKYWITAITQGWDNGPTTSLTLRRAHV